MKRTLIIVTAGLMMAVGAYMVVAAEGKQSQDVTLLAHGRGAWGGWGGWGEGPMRGHGAQCGPMGACPQHGAMMRMMMGKEIVPTQDGGAIVMIGCQLFKYDKDLNHVGQAEIKVDVEAMQNKIRKLMENCPMYKQMMEEQEDDDDKGKDDDDR